MIDPNNFSYKATRTEDIRQVGSFTWDLFFDWRTISREDEKMRKDETDPLK